MSAALHAAALIGGIAGFVAAWTLTLVFISDRTHKER